METEEFKAFCNVQDIRNLIVSSLADKYSACAASRIFVDILKKYFQEEGNNWIEIISVIEELTINFSSEITVNDLQIGIIKNYAKLIEDTAIVPEVTGLLLAFLITSNQPAIDQIYREYPNVRFKNL